MWSRPSALAVDRKRWLMAQRAVEQMRAAAPRASREALLRKLISEHCVRAGLAGAATTVATVVPGIGPLADLAFGIVGDAVFTSHVQLDLILRIFALYEREPQLEDERRILIWLGTVGAGGTELVEQIANQIAGQVITRFAGRVLKRGLPLFEVLLSTSTHVVGTYLVAERARRWCETGDDRLDFALKGHLALLTELVQSTFSQLFTGAERAASGLWAFASKLLPDFAALGQAGKAYRAKRQAEQAARASEPLPTAPARRPTARRARRPSSAGKPR